MGLSPKKTTITPKATKAPGKTILPRSKFQKQRAQQRRFSLIDSDSSLSDFESGDEDDDTSNRKGGSHKNRGGFLPPTQEFHAIESSDEEDEDDDDDDGSSTSDEIWRNNSNKVVNTSSEDEDGESEEDDVSSSDDEDVDFVKLTAERKAKSLEAYKSNTPFRSPSPSKNLLVTPQEDVDFSFNFNGNDHQLKIANEEEDVGEDLGEVMPPVAKDIPLNNNEPLGFMDIEESSESDGDIDKEELLRTLEQDSDGLNDGLETGDDELAMLQHEADIIAQEYDEDGLQLSSANVTPRNSVVEEMIKKHKAENEEVLEFISDDEYDSNDDYDEDDYGDDFAIPYFDDSMFKEKLFTEGLQKSQREKEENSDDDSYLWDYFFSSGGEDNDDDRNNNEDKNQILSDDEATDEDETLPPPSTKKIGSKAQELLSSSSVTARPPALGTWSTDSKPFGIIDGLSTRSLLPSNSALTKQLNTGVPNNNNSITNNTKLPNGVIEEFTLDELLNMSELEDDENEDTLEWSELTNVGGNDRKVPLSAFRNKGIINEQPASLINATRRFSLSNNNHHQSHKKHLKISKNARFNEITMTPGKQPSKSIKKSSKMTKMRRQSMAEAAVEGMRVTRSGLFSEDTLSNVEEFLSGLGNEAELSILFREIE